MVLFERRSQVWMLVPSRKNSLMVGVKGLSAGRVKPPKVDVGRVNATAQGTAVVWLRSWDPGVGNSILPESVGFLSLCDAVVHQEGIRPACSAVAVQLRPVAVPGWCSIVSLSGVVPALKVSASPSNLEADSGKGSKLTLLHDEPGTRPCTQHHHWSLRSGHRRGRRIVATVSCYHMQRRIFHP